MRCNSFSFFNRSKLQYRKVKNNVHWFICGNLGGKSSELGFVCIRESSSSWVRNNRLLPPSCLLAEQIGSGTAKFSNAKFSLANETHTTHDNDSQRQMRKERLHFHLIELGIDAESLACAAYRSISTTGMLHVDRNKTFYSVIIRLTIW